MEGAAQLGQAAAIVKAFTPSNAASLAALEIFLSILGSSITVFGVFLPLGEAVAATEEELTYEQLVGGILAGGLGGRRGPGGRSGDPGDGSNPNADPIPYVPKSQGQPNLQPASTDPDAILPVNNPGSVSNPPNSNGEGGDEGGDTPAIVQPEPSDPEADPTVISNLGWVAPGILTNMANTIWQDVSNEM